MTVDSGVQCERKRTLLAPECFQRTRTSSRAWMGEKALRKRERADKGSWARSELGKRIFGVGRERAGRTGRDGVG